MSSMIIAEENGQREYKLHKGAADEAIRSNRALNSMLPGMGFARDAAEARKYMPSRPDASIKFGRR